MKTIGNRLVTLEAERAKVDPLPMIICQWGSPNDGLYRTEHGQVLTPAEFEELETTHQVILVMYGHWPPEEAEKYNKPPYPVAPVRKKTT